ncbi:MAG: hypothetical protein M1829_005128 [Trizodia sp. TS-e1964]|nr:MAG: hypothetical protein M1829_005128 [Trizodia sp. TS-e1964]
MPVSSFLDDLISLDNSYDKSAQENVAGNQMHTKIDPWSSLASNTIPQATKEKSVAHHGVDQLNSNSLNAFLNPVFSEERPPQQSNGIGNKSQIKSSYNISDLRLNGSSQHDIYKSIQPEAELLFENNAPAGVEEEDDFGDFESSSNFNDISDNQNFGTIPPIVSTQVISPRNSHRPKRPGNANLSLDTKPVYPEKTPGALLASNKSPLADNHRNLKPTELSSHFDEDWGDFIDSPVLSSSGIDKETLLEEGKITLSCVSSQAPSQSLENPPGRTTNKGEEKNILQSQRDLASSLPPTNIPPPSSLLSLFLPLLSLPRHKLFQPLSNQSQSLKNRILSDPATTAFLQGYVKIAIVAARIIAGRKLRWKRDQLLAQANKIGPASSGKAAGMKLAGVDKNETLREEREVSELVRVWRENLGRLRSAVATAQETASGLKDALPEIAEVIPIRVAKTSEGGIFAPKPCALCGLRRDERIEKPDSQINDSFGEWWVEHWGHRTCQNFWHEQERVLRQR